MPTPMPLLSGRWQGGHDFCPFPPEEWVSVAMLTPSIFYKEDGEVAMTLTLLFW